MNGEYSDRYYIDFYIWMGNMRLLITLTYMYEGGTFGYIWYIDLKAISKFYRRHFDLVLMSDLNLFCNKAYRNLNFMVMKYINSENRYACNDFSTQFRKIILQYIKIGYNINDLWQTASMVVNPITVNNFAFLFGCTSAGRTSDSITAPAKTRCFGSGRAHRSPAVGFLFLHHFSYFLLSSPHRCFISVFVWVLCSRRCCTDELETFNVVSTVVLCIPSQN